MIENDIGYIGFDHRNLNGTTIVGCLRRHSRESHRLSYPISLDKHTCARGDRHCRRGHHGKQGCASVVQKIIASVGISVARQRIAHKIATRQRAVGGMVIEVHFNGSTTSCQCSCKQQGGIQRIGIEITFAADNRKRAFFKVNPAVVLLIERHQGVPRGRVGKEAIFERGHHIFNDWRSNDVPHFHLVVIGHNLLLNRARHLGIGNQLCAIFNDKITTFVPNEFPNGGQFLARLDRQVASHGIK